MEKFIEDLKNSNTILCILTDELGFRITFTTEINDYDLIANGVKVYTQNGMELDLFRTPDGLMCDDEGYEFAYGKTYVYISFI